MGERIDCGYNLGVAFEIGGRRRGAHLAPDYVEQREGIWDYRLVVTFLPLSIQDALPNYRVTMVV